MTAETDDDGDAIMEMMCGDNATTHRFFGVFTHRRLFLLSVTLLKKVAGGISA
jgi:hypothetical protein